ncbi:hypothetical protein Pelo_262 [Pelomyxa schiedti]|nr:hypothetical protein Pelo_262 [Pelomyxa schiedti]
MPRQGCINQSGNRRGDRPQLRGRIPPENRLRIQTGVILMYLQETFHLDYQNEVQQLREELQRFKCETREKDTLIAQLYEKLYSIREELDCIHVNCIHSLTHRSSVTTNLYMEQEAG